MSRNHSSITHNVRSVLHDTQSMSYEEIENEYGIEILDDGRVFDPIDNQYHESLGDWAQAQLEADERDNFEHIHGAANADDWC